VGPRPGLEILEKKKISFPCRKFEPPDHPARSLVIIPTTLSRLLT
jgi:hypothetical protein